MGMISPSEIKMVHLILARARDTLTADYPKHPDKKIVKGMEEKDIYNYYEGAKSEMLKELKNRNLFVRLHTDNGFTYVRHPFDKNSEYIRISNAKEFEKYNNGGTVEFHVTMPAQCPYYIVDLDAAGDWSHTKKVVGEIADGLDKLSEVKKVEIRYTGKRGFHILGWLKKTKPIDKAREDLKDWLKETFGERKDLVVQESPSGSKGALGVSPMKLNGGQVAKWSLRVSGLCCIEVPRSKLISFQEEEATPEKTFKKLTGRTMKTKEAAVRVMKAFLEKDSFIPSIPTNRTQGLMKDPIAPKKQFDPNIKETFAQTGEMIWVLNKAGEWTQIPWSSEMETKIKG